MHALGVYSIQAMPALGVYSVQAIEAVFVNRAISCITDLHCVYTNQQSDIMMQPILVEAILPRGVSPLEVRSWVACHTCTQCS